MQDHSNLQGWQGARMQRVASGFYTSQAWEWTRS
jgi:magnesium-protoporphyrin O-methyltransferase